MYNFYFDAQLPAAPADATLGLFRPGTPDSVSFMVPTPFNSSPPSFIRGDVNNDQVVSGLTDSLFLLNYGFTGGPTPPCLDAADINDDGDLNPLVDTLILLNFQFNGGAAPAAPHPGCGEDPTSATSVGCQTFCP